LPSSNGRWEDKLRPWHIKSGSRHSLFADISETRLDISCDVADAAEDIHVPPPARLDALIGEQVAELFERADDPGNGAELCRLAIGRTESKLGREALRPELADIWRATARRRSVDPQDLLRNPALAELMRRLFNFFFQRDLYGDLPTQGAVILSSGSFDETAFGLPNVLKQCVQRALSENWYGYSHSNGREQTREAVAALETVRSAGALNYTAKRIAVTLGGTSAMSTIVSCAAAAATRPRPLALCAIPNYPPLVSSVADRFDIEFVPTPIHEKTASADSLVRQIEIRKPDLVLLQSVINPTGAEIDENDIARVIRAAPAGARIVLDESHECFKPRAAMSPARGAPNVVRLLSFSKAMAAPGLKIGWIASSAEFVEAFYERASVAYGGPVSLFYLLIEIYARFEAWRLEGRRDLLSQDLSYFEKDYRLNLRGLNNAFRSYCSERSAFESTVFARREEAMRRLQRLDLAVLPPKASINVFFRLPGADSYTAFRQIFTGAGVALYPGLLAFCSEDCWLRLSPCVASDAFNEGFDRLSRWITRSRHGSSAS
jgi:aspartate/methionine/tyrosine aminotransferase